MKVTKKDLEKSQIELTVELSVKEFEPYIQKGADKVSKEVKIDGFRTGKVPYDVLKQKVGEMAILEESARIAINKTLEEAIKKNVKGQPVGQPRVDITKIAPDNPLEYKVIIAIIPSVELGEYKDLKVKKKKTKIEETEIEKTLEHLREMRVKEALVDRAVEDKDKVTIDLQMFLDKVPVEGGQSVGVAIIIGKDYIVPGFDKQLIGAKKGETKEFSLPYPKEHHMKNLAGKMVDFKITVKEVYTRELPELDDDFAKSFNLKKLEELKDDIKKNMESQKDNENKRTAEREMLENIIGKSKFGDIPEILISHESDTMMAELEQGIAQQGGKFEDYLASIGKNRDEMALEMLPEATKRVKISLVIRAIAEAEKIEATEKDLQKNIDAMREQYKDNADIVKRFETPEYKAYAQNVLTSQKVVEKLTEWNIA